MVLQCWSVLGGGLRLREAYGMTCQSRFVCTHIGARRLWLPECKSDAILALLTFSLLVLQAGRSDVCIPPVTTIVVGWYYAPRC